MKNLILILSTLIFFTSCKKEFITPGSYEVGKEPQKDTSTWVWQFPDSGVLPNNNTNNDINPIVGTTWVLTKYVTQFATVQSNDTIRFVDNRYYTINNGAVIPYSLSSGVSTTSKTLTLYYFYPFGSGHFSGQVSQNFITDGVISNSEFKNIETTNTLIKAWFKKI